MKTKLHYLIIAVLFSCNSFAQFTQLSLTGSGVGGWGVDTDLTTTDGVIYTKSNLQILGTGGGSSEVKFREAHDWAVAYGYLTGSTGWPSGVGLASGSVSNIPAVPGYWNVTFNYTTKAYSFTPGVNPYSVIKVSGTALAADALLSTTNGEAYAKESVTFGTGTGKFIEEGTANQWTSVDFPVGTGTQSGGLIPITAGTYYVYFYKSSGNYSFDPTVVSMIGNFVGSGWGTDVDLNTTDNVHFTTSNWVATPTGTDTNVKLKFRDNHSWNFQFGSVTAGVTPVPSGTATDTNTQDMTIPPGTYNVTFNRSTYEYTFQDALAVNSFAATNFSVFPNPTSSSWSFVSKNDAPIVSIVVVDVLGKTVLTKNGSSNTVSIDSSNLTNGIYFAKIATATATETVKLVKN